ncbi:MAG: 50S ribosomal protein L28 [Dethiobacter sp.]|nr:50S ribosomal protein L28 [Dethiobacter sp.]MBS3901373.1 50S ribosomal protein L28 [Dethiobacter sp.]MBS3990284.1 50S ribosomal protein L28 [Dethiobacter sp.]
MSRRCTVCGKGTETGLAVSHSNIKTKRTWRANVQKVKSLVDGNTRRVKVCTRCLKAGKVKRVG